MLLIGAAGAAWSVAFALFLVEYAPMLLGPRPGSRWQAERPCGGISWEKFDLAQRQLRSFTSEKEPLAVRS